MARKKSTGDDGSPFAASEAGSTDCAAGQQAADFGEQLGALVQAQAHEQGAALQAAVVAHASQARQVARYLYWQSWRPKLIAEHLGVPASTVYGWRDAEEWDKFKPLDRVNGALELRMVQLIMKEAKSGSDFKEIDLLGRQLERTARVERYQETGKEGT